MLNEKFSKGDRVRIVGHIPGLTKARAERYIGRTGVVMSEGDRNGYDDDKGLYRGDTVTVALQNLEGHLMELYMFPETLELEDDELTRTILGT